jgi:aryl-alcohol dehydrogenase-like predicted oxidoreductase
MALGTWGLSGDAYGAVDAETAERVVNRALDVGITTFDTADAYGAGRMEMLLGKVLRARGKREGEVVVVTKGGTDRATEPPRKRFTDDYLRASVERSARRLGRPRLDVYLLHNPSVECLDAGEATRTMLALKAEGKIAHWGVSAGDAETALAAIGQEAEVLELAYNLFHAADLHRIAGDVMVAGTGVLARSTLGYGLLAGEWTKERTFLEGDHRVDRWTRHDLERRIDQLQAVRYLVKGNVRTMRGAAVRWVLANTVVSAAVLGPRSVEQLEQLVREVGAGPIYIPDPDLAALPRALAKVGVLV